MGTNLTICDPKPIVVFVETGPPRQYIDAGFTLATPSPTSDTD